MYRPTTPVARRRGVVLLIVLSMLMLFAIVGISFVIYASAERDTNRTLTATPNQTSFDIEPELLCSLALGQIIYDVPDDQRGAYSALRGHSLARNMFGYNDGVNAPNDTPYSGPGRLNLPSLFPNSAIANAQNDAYLINYVWAYDPNNPAATLPMRDPEHVGARPAFNPNVQTPDQYASALTRGSFLAANPSYNYPDHNSLFMAAVMADGTVLTPSYHREWLFGRLDAQNNPNWTNQEGRYLTLRPRPIDMGPGFPQPTDRYGDVKNLVWGPGGCDSIWIDINAPVMTGPDGRRYKILVAPLVMDLNNKLNVTVAGNVMGPTVNSLPTHTSNQGWGPWEMNVSKILNSPTAVNEYLQLFFGKPNPAGGNQMVLPGKYGFVGIPPPLLISPFLVPPHQRAAVDYNGGSDAAGQVPAPFQVAWPSNNPQNTVPYQNWPWFPPTYGNASKAELTNHASGYNPFRPPPGAKNNRVFNGADMNALLRQFDTGSESSTAHLLQLLPNNMTAPDNTSAAGIAAMRRRNMLTPFSFTLDRPAMTPYVFDPTAPATIYGATYNLTANSPNYYPFGAAAFPTGQPVPFPSVSLRGNTPYLGDFDAATWRSAVAKFGKIDLNRPLSPYADAKGNFLHQAELDRQNLAKDIFNRLCWVTGANSPFTLGNPMVPTPPAGQLYDPQFEASRYLAQLAANMVDYIDGDDYNTVFIWNPIDPTVADPWNDPNPKNNNLAAAAINQRLVFGTEAPKLALNEVYAQFDNDPTDPGLKNIAPKRRKATTFNVNVFIELVNPFPDESQTTGYDNTAYLLDPNTGNQIYQILLTDPYDPKQQPFLTPDNVLGDPTPAMKIRNAAIGGMDFGQKNAVSSAVLPLNNAYSGALNQNQGFYVIGPKPIQFMDQQVPPDQDPLVLQNPQYPNLPVTYPSTSMTYVQPVTVPGAAVPNPTPMVLLRRLVYPNQPPNPATPGGQYNPNVGPYNPYLTVDYLDPVLTQDSRIYTNVAAGLNPAYVAMKKRFTLGRKQPYDSNTPLVPQVLANPPANAPVNSFFRHNYEDPINAPTFQSQSKTLTIPFNWLPQLDRPLINPVELLQVSAHKPHELTHTFVQNTVPYSQAAPWLLPQTRLFRFMEMVETASRLPGTVVGGRIPGQMNINNIWDQEVFLAAADAQPANTFFNTNPKVGNGDPDWYVKQVFTQTLANRSPNLANANGPLLGPNDRPIKSLGATYYTGNADPLDPQYVATPPGQATPRGVNDTLFGTPLNGLSLMQAGVPNINNPYQTAEMLTKVFNSFTTHSDTFAVFLTVGYFEVVDETTRPVKLGAEINAAQGTNIRHRMFAIVDRTNLEVFGQPATAPVATTVNLDTGTTGWYPYEVQIDAPNGPKSNQTVVSPLSGTNQFTGRTWQIQSGSVQFQPGSVLVIEPNTANEETVTVYSKPHLAGMFVQLRRPHLANSPIISRGNPGPWISYNPRQDPGVVPFFAIIN